MAFFTAVKDGPINDGDTFGNTSPGVAGVDYPDPAGGDAIDVAGYVVTVPIDYVLDKQGEGQPAATDSAAYDRQESNIVDGALVKDGDITALYAAGRHVYMNGVASEVNNTVLLATFADGVTTITFNEGEVVPSGSGVPRDFLAGGLVASANLDMTNGGFTNLRVGAHGHDEAVPDVIDSASAETEELWATFQVEGDVAAKYPAGMYIHAEGTVGGANDGYYVVQWPGAEYDAETGFTAIPTYWFADGIAITSDVTFKYALENQAAETGTLTALSPYLISGDGTNACGPPIDISHLWGLVASDPFAWSDLACFSLNGEYVNDSTAQSGTEANGIESGIYVPCLIVAVDGSSVTNCPSGSAFNADCVTGRLGSAESPFVATSAGGSTDEPNSYFAIGNYGWICDAWVQASVSGCTAFGVAISNVSQESGGGVFTGAGFASLHGTAAADGTEGIAISAGAPINELRITEITCTNGARAFSLNYPSGSWSFLFEDMTVSVDGGGAELPYCPVELTSGVLYSGGETNSTITITVTNAPSGQNPAFRSTSSNHSVNVVATIDYGIAVQITPPNDQPLSLPTFYGDLTGTSGDERGVRIVVNVFGDVHGTTLANDNTGIDNRGCIIGSAVSDDPGTENNWDGSGLVYPAPPDEMVAIASVVAKEWVVTGHTNYEGGDGGEYPTTEDSKQEQYETDQAAVLAVAEQISDQVAPLGVPGQMDVSALLTGARLTQLGEDIAAVEAAKASINDDTTILTIQGTQDLAAAQAASYAEGYAVGENNGTILF